MAKNKKGFRFKTSLLQKRNPFVLLLISESSLAWKR